MSEKGQKEGREETRGQKPEEAKEQKPDNEQDLTTFLSHSQCSDLTLLVAIITEQMRKSIEVNFDPTATLNLVAVDKRSEDDKILDPKLDPGTVDVSAIEAEKKLLAQREKELSTPEFRKIKEEALKQYDEWRKVVVLRVGEAVNKKKEAEKQMSEAAKIREEPQQLHTQLQKAPLKEGNPEQSAPKLEDCFPRVKTSLTKLSIANRKLVLHSILLLLISLEHYSARSRVLLLYLTSSLKVSVKVLQEDEEQVAKGLLESAQQINADQEAKGKVEASKSSRKWKVAAATAAGAAVVGVTGGMAAPALASGVGAVMGGLGLGTTAAAGYLGAVAGSTYLVGGLFGAYGGQMTGQMMDNLSREVEDFAFLPIHGRRKEFSDDNEAAAEDRRLRVTIGITGWLTEKEEIVKPWRVLNTGSEAFALRWELETLLNLGNSVNTMLSSAAWGAAQSQIIGKTIFAELMSSMTWPMGLAKVARVVDNPFTLAKTRADKAGEVLADALINKAQGERSVTLIGYSMGARAIYACLTSLAKRKAFGLVESAVLIGAPTPSDTASWRMVRSACAGRLINVYSENDRVLAFLYRTSSIQYGIAGLSKIEGLPGVENIDVSETVNGHLRYRFLVGKILQRIGLQDIDMEEIKHEEEAYEKMLEEEKEQDYIRQAKEKSQSYLGRKEVSDKDAEKEAGAMEKEIEQKNHKSMMQWATEQLYITRTTASDPDKAAEVGGKALKSGANAADGAAVAGSDGVKSYYQSASKYLSRSGSKDANLAKEGISEVGPSYMTQAALYASKYLPSWSGGAAGQVTGQAAGAAGTATGAANDPTKSATDTTDAAKGGSAGYLASAASYIPSYSSKNGEAAGAADDATKSVTKTTDTAKGNSGGYLGAAASYIPSWSSGAPKKPETTSEKATDVAGKASNIQEATTDKTGEVAHKVADAGGITVQNASSMVGSTAQGATDTVGSGSKTAFDKAGAPEVVGDTTDKVVKAVGVTPKNASEMVGKAGSGATDKVGEGLETGISGAGKAPGMLGSGLTGAAGMAGEVTGVTKK